MLIIFFKMIFYMKQLASSFNASFEFKWVQRLWSAASRSESPSNMHNLPSKVQQQSATVGDLAVLFEKKLFKDRSIHLIAIMRVVLEI